MIDGMRGAEACYHFAGIIGLAPERRTLRQLWRMATGRIMQNRFAMAEQASLVWGMADMDMERYLLFGEMRQTGRGGPVQMSPEMQLKVQAEIDRLRAENPNLPKIVK